jgi:hypothetical protein
MSAETLSLIAGAFLSLCFSYIPGISERFDALTPTEKRLVMLGTLILMAVSAYGLACLGWGRDWGITLTCNRVGLSELKAKLIIAIVANQGIYAKPRCRS